MCNLVNDKDKKKELIVLNLLQNKEAEGPMSKSVQDIGSQERKKKKEIRCDHHGCEKSTTSGEMVVQMCSVGSSTVRCQESP